MQICKQCQGLVGLAAMQFTKCEKCNIQVVSPHIPHYKYCGQCAVELNVCKQCGEKMDTKHSGSVKLKVYRVYGCSGYRGFALIAANSSTEANEIILDFKRKDDGNKMDSWGYEYVDEEDIVEGIWGDKKGFIIQNIYYVG